MEKGEVAKVMDTIMSIPGMNEVVKMDFKISRRNVLLLDSIIKIGMNPKDNDHSGLLESVTKDSLQDIRTLSESLLDKAGLKELSEKLKGLAK
jgi:hypothetical protein